MHRYVRRNKTDRTEAKALLEAHRNEEIHPVPVKSVDQQALTALHRLRATWLAARTARINTLRGVLREFGVVIPIGTHHVVPVLRQLAEHPRVPTALHAIAQAAADEIVWLERALHDLEHRLEALATQLPDVDLLRTIPGSGSSRRPRWSPVWAVRDACPRAGILPVTLGLTAREDSSAQHRHLGAISKQGNTCVRMLLIHGARSVLWSAKGKLTPTTSARGRCARSSAGATTWLRSPSPTNSLGLPGPCGRGRCPTSWPLTPRNRTHSTARDARTPVGPARGHPDNSREP